MKSLGDQIHYEKKMFVPYKKYYCNYHDHIIDKSFKSEQKSSEQNFISFPQEPNNNLFDRNYSENLRTPFNFSLQIDDENIDKNQIENKESNIIENKDKFEIKIKLSILKR